MIRGVAWVRRRSVDEPSVQEGEPIFDTTKLNLPDVGDIQFGSGIEGHLEIRRTSREHDEELIIVVDSYHDGNACSWRRDGVPDRRICFNGRRTCVPKIL